MPRNHALAGQGIWGISSVLGDRQNIADSGYAVATLSPVPMQGMSGIGDGDGI